MLTGEEIKMVDKRMWNAPPSHEHIYFHLKNNLEKPTGNWQKHSCTTKARIRVHTESGEKGGEVIRLRSVPQKVAQRKREITQEQRSSLGGDWFEPHISALVLGSDKGKTSPLGWLEGLWEWQEGYGKAWTLLLRNMHATCLFLE